MGPKTRELIELLGELSGLLRRYEEKSWASRIERDAATVESGDFRGITDLLSMYGGMGSFNDLILHPANGHQLANDEIEAVNIRLSALSSRAWDLANDIKHEAVFDE